MIDWDYFKKVRKLDVKRWLKSRDVKNYVEFVAALKVSGIRAPSEFDVRDLFAVEQKPVEPVKVTSELPAEILVEPISEVNKPAKSPKPRRQLKVESEDAGV